MTVDECIHSLVAYGEKTGLILPEDKIYATNRILELLQLDEYNAENCTESSDNLETILTQLLDYAYSKHLFPDNTITWRDIFDTRLMACITPPPSLVNRMFNEKYKVSPEAGTDFYYKFSCDTNYIRRDRIKKDLKWQVSTEYGALDITINLSKPEKDPKAIAAAKLSKQSGYPKCQLCIENEGYAGRINHPARGNHRIMPIDICGEKWGFQYSPYVYYNEHCIVLNSNHTPMVISENVFAKLFSFVSQFPHYFVGSNADLPIVGGSILTHEHFQGGRYEFPMAKAPIEEAVSIPGYTDIETGIVNWPMSVIRLRGTDIPRIVQCGGSILSAWRKYTDKDAFIFSETNGEPHNTITPIARKRNNVYELDLVLRNNITTEEHPLGVFHPHAELHHIKKENIGLIEVMGLAVLPSRLKKELTDLEPCLLGEQDPAVKPETEKHAAWIDELKQKYSTTITKENVSDILREETGLVFKRVLEDAGVYKRTPEGKKAFRRFIASL